MKLAGEAYRWWEDSYIDCQYWLILQELLHTRYAPHLEGPQFSDMIVECKKILTGMVKILESKAVKIVEDPEPEPEVDDKSGPEDVAKLVTARRDFFHGPRKL